MKVRTLSLFSIFFSLALPLGAQHFPSIRAIYELPPGSQVTLEGVINCPDFGVQDGHFFVQSSNGGIGVYFTNTGGAFGIPTNYDEGDTVRIHGHTQNLGALHILPDQIDLLSPSENLPEPSKISNLDLNAHSRFQGMRIEISGVRLPSPHQWPATPIHIGESVDVEALVNDTPFKIRINRRQSFFDGSSPPQEPFTLRGILTHSGDQVYVLPFQESDISSETTTNTFEALKLSNNIKVYPNPVREEINLEILPSAGRVNRVVITDIAGRTVAKYDQLNAQNQILKLGIPAGVQTGQYFLSVWTENGLRANKLMAIKN